MKNTRGVVTGVAAAGVSVGLLFSASPAQALDIPQPGGNTVQVTTGGDVFRPEFTLWPLPGNNSHNTTTSNSAIDRGTFNNDGKAWLFGFGSGNVVQFATGGNIIAPQVALGRDNNAENTTWGNEAIGNGTGSSSEGASRGLLFDGNGNVFQVAFLQGNIIAPQLAVLGDNNAKNSAYGNYAEGNGNGASAFGTDGFAFVTGNGNIIQIEILSDNIIAPQFSFIGDNNLDAYTEGNVALDNGNEATTTGAGPQNPFAGIFSVTGNGNVTHIAILSNNIWAPQVALLGHNTNHLVTNVNDAVDNGNDGEVSVDNANPPAPPRPILNAVRSVVAPLTGGKTPVLDAIEKSLPERWVVGSGNVDQHSESSGNVRSDTFSFNLKPKVAVPVNVEPEPVVDESDNGAKVTESFKAVPGETLDTLAGDNDKKKPGVKHTVKHYKPGDGIKAVKAAVKKAVSDVKAALKPKPKAATP